MLDHWKAKSVDCQAIPEDCRFDASEEVLSDEIGDGNLNFVTRLYTVNKSGQLAKSIVVKHAPPYIKILGEDYPLTAERIYFEYRALFEFHTLSPGSVPHPYHFDHKTHSLYMEDLREFTILRKSLMDGIFSLKLMDDIVNHLAMVHQETHVSKIGEEKLAALDKEFKNTEMMDLTRQYVFTRPFTRDDETNKSSDAVKERLHLIYDDPQVLQAADRLLKIFLNKKECLLHGDLHTGSFMVKGIESKMFDVEFTFVGPAAFDVGTLLSQFIFSYYRHMSIEENNDQHRQFAQLMIESCKCLVKDYLQLTTAYADPEKFSTFMSEVAGYAGCELVRRTVGAAHVEDVDEMPLAQQECLGAGVRLLKAMNRIHNTDRLLVIALMLA